MRTSLEKIADFTEELQGPPGPDADAFELAIKTAMQLGGPMLDSLLPDDPMVLDGYLENVAHSILEMRSDNAHPLVIMPMDEVVDAEVLEEKRELPAGQ